KHADKVIADKLRQRMPEAERTGHDLPAKSTDNLNSNVQGEGAQPPCQAQLPEGFANLAPVGAPGQPGQQNHTDPKTKGLSHEPRPPCSEVAILSGKTSNAVHPPYQPGAGICLASSMAVEQRSTQSPDPAAPARETCRPCRSRGGDRPHP